MIVDASVVVDAVCDPGPRGVAARRSLSEVPPSEPLSAPGHFAFEVLSALSAAARRPGHPFTGDDMIGALAEAEGYAISIEPTPWVDVHRARELSERSLRFADAVSVAAAERQHTALLTADGRIARSGAPISCSVVTVVPAADPGTIVRSGPIDAAPSA